jgi:hypothetical protein
MCVFLRSLPLHLLLLLFLLLFPSSPTVISAAHFDANDQPARPSQQLPPPTAVI